MIPATASSVKSVQDVYLGGLAGTVRADNPERGPRCHLQLRLVAGMPAAEPLVEGALLDCRRALPPLSPLPRRVCWQYRYGAGQLPSAT